MINIYESMIHRDIASFETDVRVGAVLLNDVGQVLMTRCRPSHLDTPSASTVVDPYSRRDHDEAPTVELVGRTPAAMPSDMRAHGKPSPRAGLVQLIGGTR